MTITITEEQLRDIVVREVMFTLAKLNIPCSGYSIAKHKVDSTDNSKNWSQYWESNHAYHHFPSDANICPSCLLHKTDFVGGHITCSNDTYIIPVCDGCNKEYKCSKADEHPFYVKTEDMVRVLED